MGFKGWAWVTKGCNRVIAVGLDGFRSGIAVVLAWVRFRGPRCRNFPEGSM